MRTAQKNLLNSNTTTRPFGPDERQQRRAPQTDDHLAGQNHTYDALNRIGIATETVNSTVTWQQDFNYDRFGNRSFNAANTTTLPADNAVCNTQVNPADNKFYSADGYIYDSEGNLTLTPDGLSIAYNAENKQSQLYNSATQTTSGYDYDGEGQTVVGFRFVISD